MLIILSGPSGVGKGTIRKEIMSKYPNLDLHYSISMTTRPPRKLEQDGKDYFFVDEATFNKNVEEGNFLEHASFVGNQYGTPKDYVEKLRNEGKNVLLEIEVQGAKQVLAKMQGDDIISIFLIPPSFHDLTKRILKRKSETPEIMRARLQKAAKELGERSNYKYIVLNDVVTKAAEEIENIIEKEIKKQQAN